MSAQEVGVCAYSHAFWGYIGEETVVMFFVCRLSLLLGNVVVEDAVTVALMCCVALLLFSFEDGA